MKSVKLSINIEYTDVIFEKMSESFTFVKSYDIEEEVYKIKHEIEDDEDGETLFFRVEKNSKNGNFIFFLIESVSTEDEIYKIESYLKFDITNIYNFQKFMSIIGAKFMMQNKKTVKEFLFDGISVCIFSGNDVDGNESHTVEIKSSEDGNDIRDKMFEIANILGFSRSYLMRK